MEKRSPYSKKVGVYQIRNTINNRIYIGSSFNIAARWREHKYDLRMNKHSNEHLQKAYNKYGKEAFVYEVLEILDSTEHQFEREQYWIDLKEACNRKKGYNIQSEVLVVPKVTKKVVCLETLEVFNSLEEASYAKGISAGSISCCCNKRKLKQTGGYHWMFYNEYVSASAEDIKKVVNNKWKQIICLETGEVFKSYHETGLKKGSVQSCCTQTAKGNIISCFGKHYLYKEDYDSLSEEQIKSIIEYRPEGYKGSGEVICLETGVVYKNARRAEIEANLPRSAEGILKCCYKKAITCKNLHWLFKKDYDKLTKEQKERYGRKSSKDSSVKSIVCLETGKIYCSQVEAAKETGVSKSTINKICKNNGYNFSKNSLHFVFTENYKVMTKEEIEKVLNATPKNIRKVKCVETNIVYNSVTEAARSVNDQTSNISKCCKNSNKVCKGFHWKYV